MSYIFMSSSTKRKFQNRKHLGLYYRNWIMGIQNVDIYIKIASVILVCLICTVPWSMFALQCNCYLITLGKCPLDTTLEFSFGSLRYFLCSLVLTRKNSFAVADVGWGQLRNSYQFNCNSQNQSGYKSCDKKRR